MEKYPYIAIFAALFIAHTGVCQTQQDILLQQSEMPGYVLERQGPSFMQIALEKSQETIQQTWLKEGDDKEKEIQINFAIFSSVDDAFRGVLYNKGCFSGIYDIGTIGGYMIGDKSWFPRGNFSNSSSSIIFLRGNVAVHIFKPSASESDFPVIEQISRTILNKIESSLSSDIRRVEEEKKTSQISSSTYQRITGDVVTSEYMKGYSLFSSWDSKWFIEPGGFFMGRRTEWKNERGGVSSE